MIPRPPVRRRIGAAIATAETRIDHQRRNAWAIVTSDGRIYTGEFQPADGSPSLQGCFAAFEHLLTDPDLANDDITLQCGNEQFLDTILPMAHVWPNLAIPTANPGAREASIVRWAALAAKNFLRGRPLDEGRDADPVQDPVPAPSQMSHRRVLHAATDGSARWHSNGKASGYGWITSDGRHGLGQVRGNFLIAELRAIHDLLERINPAQRMLVAVDCREALSLVHRFQTGDDEYLERMVARFERPFIRTLGAHVRARRTTVEFEWVKGHNGHPLNEAADRLALQARRAHDLGVPVEARRIAVRNIVDDAMAQQVTFAAGSRAGVQDAG